MVVLAPMEMEGFVVQFVQRLAHVGTLECNLEPSQAVAIERPTYVRTTGLMKR